MVFLISYDISQKTKGDDATVIDLLKSMGAVRCLYSEWLLSSDSTAEALAKKILEVLSPDDGLLVVRIDDWASFNLRNPDASAKLLNTV
jgi:hypothetical protein